MTQPTLDAEVLRSWIGRTDTVDEVLQPGPATRLAATLDRDSTGLRAGAPLPPLWHWIYFLSAAPRSGLGRDGHPVLGGFLPPVALARRMWAGGRLRFPGEVRLGDAARKVSTIRDVQLKQGRSGTLCFVTLLHEISVDGTVRTAEEQDIVYRAEARDTRPTAPEVAPTDADLKREIKPDPTLLFRYSALTFNGHRIHYDRDYAAGVEGYDGLVVHGPLIATLLVDIAARAMPGQAVGRFEFRAVAPLVDTAPFTVNGRRVGEREARAWAADQSGRLAMIATAYSQ